MTVSQLKDFLDKCGKSGFADMEANVLINTYDTVNECTVVDEIINAYILDNGRVVLQGQSMREV